MQEGESHGGALGGGSACKNSNSESCCVRPCVRSSAERTREGGGGGKHDTGADGEPRSVEQTAAALIDSLVCAGVARDTTLLACGWWLAGLGGEV